MSTVYLASNNGVLSEKDNVLFYEDYRGNKTKLLPQKISQIIVIGRLTITGSAFTLLFQYQISVVFIRKNGKHVGRLLYSDKKNVALRHKQHEVCSNSVMVASIAKDIVRGKIHNQYLFMQRINRKSKSDAGFIDSQLSEMNRIRRLLESAKDISIIRGYEGDASRLYFSCLGMNINCDWTSFTSRSKNPPLDPVNAVLSFLYTVLAHKIGLYLYELGLDSGVGTLHAISYGRDSLVYDLIEEFRTPIVDTLTCSLFNLGILKEEDFAVESYSDDIREGEDEILIQNTEVIGEAIFLNESGVKKVLEQLEKKLATVHVYPLLNKPLSYDKIIAEQAKLYKQVICGTMEHYLPMVVT